MNEIWNERPHRENLENLEQQEAKDALCENIADQNDVPRTQIEIGILVVHFFGGWLRHEMGLDLSLGIENGSAQDFHYHSILTAH